MKKVALIGSAFGHGAQIETTSRGPHYLKEQYHLEQKLEERECETYWHAIVQPSSSNTNIAKENEIAGKGKHYHAVLAHNTALFNTMKQFIRYQSNVFPIVIGGDHSCAIGTWSGVIDALSAHENFGLIWIDAHMDAHNCDTSPSQAYHGMPLSILLGRGDDALLQIGGASIKLNPQHVVLIGVRSYESAEVEYLHSKGVKIFTSHTVLEKGMAVIFQEALTIVSQATAGFGISFDLDAIDPQEAPGVGSPASEGLEWDQLKSHFSTLFQHPQCKALEITEFNPILDKNELTANIVLETVSELIYAKTPLTV